jgi:hypothetical protein
MFKISDLIGNINNAANPEVGWLSNFAESSLAWKKLKYKQYNDFLKALDRSGRVREMIKLHLSAQARKTWALKKLGEIWQHYHELLEIQCDSSRSEKWM